MDDPALSWDSDLMTSLDPFQAYFVMILFQKKYIDVSTDSSMKIPAQHTAAVG